MIWISSDLDLLEPPADLVDRFADNLRWDGVQYRKLTPPMFEALRADEEIKKRFPGRFTNVVRSIFEHGLEKNYYPNDPNFN